MKKTPLIATGITTAVVLGGGSTAYAMSNEISIDAHGEQSTIRVFGGTVEDALKGEGITLKPTDKVSPGLGTNLSDGLSITIEKQRPVTFDIDGRQIKVQTTATTVRDAIGQSGLEADLDGATISPGLDTKIGDKGATITISTTKDITFVGQRGKATFSVKDATIADAAKKTLTDYQTQDRFYDAATKKQLAGDTPVKDGMAVRIERVRTKDATTTESIANKTVVKHDSDLAEGTTKVEKDGKAGEKQIVTRTTTVDGKETGKKVLSEKVTAQPEDRVVVKGTKKDEPKAAPAPSSSDSGNGAGDTEKSAPAPKKSAPAPKKSSAPAPKKASSAKRSSSKSSDQGGKGSGPTTTCKASHYGIGDGTDGGPTASGQTFHAYGMTAAHKTLPLGTKIRVTNKANGKSVVVRVNDRGPYVSGRCLDLSAGAFRSIGNLGSGTMTVSYQRVG